MQTKNLAILIGHLGIDPVSKEVGEGKVVTTFTLATEEKWKDSKGEVQRRTDWHNIEMWGNQNLVPYLKKGTPVFVQGRHQTDNWDKTVGGEVVKMKTPKVIVDEIGLLDGKDSKDKAGE